MKAFIHNKEIEVDLWIFDKDGTLVDLKGWEKIMEERLRLIEERYGKKARKIVEPVLGYKNGNFDIKHILYTTRQETSMECSRLLGKPQEEILKVFKEADKVLENGIFNAISGAASLLRDLSLATFVIVLTNDLQKRSEKILNDLNIPYHRVIGSDTYPYYKPDPRLLFHIMQEYNIKNPRKIAVVGDSIHDVELAKKAGAISIAVLSGVGTREELANSDFIIHGITEIKIKKGGLNHEDTSQHFQKV